MAWGGSYILIVFHHKTRESFVDWGMSVCVLSCEHFPNVFNQ